MTDYEKQKSRHRWGPDCERVDQAERIASWERRGKIDGVSFDFRHTKIPADQWEPRPWWHIASDGEGSAGLAFPSDKSLGLPFLADAVQLHEGDAVQIDSVLSVDRGPNFLHPHDKTAMAADLRVIRANGDEELAPKRLLFFGTTELREGMHSTVFERMAGRLVARFDLDRLNDYDLPHFAAKKKGLEDEAIYSLRRAEMAFGGLSRCLDELDKSEDPGEVLRTYWGPGWWRDGLDALINSAALGGYLLARSETEHLEAEKIKQGAVLAEGRGKNKDFDLRRQRAREIWEVHPTYSCNRVAREIAQELNKDKSSIMASIWEEVPPTSPSYETALKKRK